MHRLLKSLLLVIWVPCAFGCYSAVESTSARNAPSFTTQAQHYRAFPDAYALAAYLRASSGAGPLVSAHRGGPVPAFPENAVETFDRALRLGPVLIETDVRLTKDSVLVLLHDETLERTTTGKGPVVEHDLSGVRRLLLKDALGIITPFRIPTLAEALAWSEGRAVLYLDVKPGVPARLIVEAIRMHQAANRVVVIVYALEEALHYFHLAPDLVLSVPMRTVEEVEAVISSDIDVNRVVAFVGTGEPSGVVIDLLHRHDVRATLGTFETADKRARLGGNAVYLALIERGIDIIATDEVALASEEVRAYSGAQNPNN